MRGSPDARRIRRQRATALVVNDNTSARLRVVLGLEGTGVGRVLAPKTLTELQTLLASSSPSVQLILHDYSFADWQVDFATIHDAVTASNLARGAELVILTAHVPDARENSLVRRKGYKVVDDESSTDDTFEGMVAEYIG